MYKIRYSKLFWSEFFVKNLYIFLNIISVSKFSLLFLSLFCFSSSNYLLTFSSYFKHINVVKLVITVLLNYVSNWLRDEIITLVIIYKVSSNVETTNLKSDSFERFKVLETTIFLRVLFICKLELLIKNSDVVIRFWKLVKTLLILRKVFSVRFSSSISKIYWFIEILKSTIKSWFQDSFFSVFFFFSRFSVVFFIV